MSGTQMSAFLRKYLADEDKKIRAQFKESDPNNKLILWMHEKTVRRISFCKLKL